MGRGKGKMVGGLFSQWKPLKWWCCSGIGDALQILQPARSGAGLSSLAHRLEQARRAMDLKGNYY